MMMWEKSLRCRSPAQNSGKIFIFGDYVLNLFVDHSSVALPRLVPQDSFENGVFLIVAAKLNIIYDVRRLIHFSYGHFHWFYLSSTFSTMSIFLHLNSPADEQRSNLEFTRNLRDITQGK